MLEVFMPSNENMSTRVPVAFDAGNANAGIHRDTAGTGSCTPAPLAHITDG